MSKLTSWKLAQKSFLHYLRSNLGVALGVAAATAVLTGALIVGDSMRGSLRELTLDRLGEIDEIVVSDGFFREQLANELTENSGLFTGQGSSDEAAYAKAVPAIMFPNGTVEFRSANGVERAANVNVFGVRDDFWSLGEGLGEIKLSGRQVVINQQLADQFSATEDGELTLRIPKPSQLPSESALGKTRDLVESLQRLEVVRTVPNRSIARFSLQPNQAEPANIFVPLDLLQDSLSATALKYKADPAQANVIFLSGNGTLSKPMTERLSAGLQPSFDDLGFAIKHVQQPLPSKEAEGETGSPKNAFEYFSVSTDRLVINADAAESIHKAFPKATELFTYLANDIRLAGSDSGVPYSMVSAVDFSDSFRPLSISGKPIRNLADNEIVLNEWTANDLKAKIGDRITVAFFEPETTHGVQVESEIEFVLADIAKLTAPASPFVVRRRGSIRPAIFDQPPTLANDPDLTPTVPGVTDAESIEKWDLPFDTMNRIRAEDDVYWENYRTTPKGFVSLAAGQKAWQSRFGNTTSFRVSATNRTESKIAESLIAQFKSDEVDLGFHVIPIKRQGLDASNGSTPFDVLFLSLSMFVIGAALILVSLLFQLALAGRLNQIGILTASGFSSGKITRVWLYEAILVCSLGAVVGVALGIGYATLMIWGLKTWWVGAISRPFLNLHIGPISIIGGLLSGILVSVVTIVRAVRATRKQSVSRLLRGEVDSSTHVARKRGWLSYVAVAMLIVAIGLAILASQLGGEAQAGSFVGAGFLVLASLLVFTWRWLQKTDSDDASSISLAKMSILSAKRNPLRSTLTIGLVAVAAFLIAAISSFHLSPVAEGVAEFDWVAESSQPIFADLNSESGQVAMLGAENKLPTDMELLSFRVKPGQDASCNNLYQSTQPRVLGVTSQTIEYFDDTDRVAFAFAGSSAKTESEKQNPWRVLLQAEDDADAIPVLIDKNTAWYSLKVFMIGQEFSVVYDSGEVVKFRVAGFLSNTILQGALLCSEENFTRAFPEIGGYRYFLIRDPSKKAGGIEPVAVLEDRLGDNGFDARDSRKLLAGFLAVQNTYLSTFQTLGALGLLLGTFGLGAVQVRNVLQRQSEIGLMRAVGWSLGRLSRMILLESCFLLLMGLGIGVLSALFATLPHYFVGDATLPVVQLAILFGVIVVVGLVTAAVTSRVVFRIPLLKSLQEI